MQANCWEFVLCGKGGAKENRAVSWDDTARLGSKLKEIIVGVKFPQRFIKLRAGKRDFTKAPFVRSSRLLELKTYSVMGLLYDAEALIR